ncbi:DUF3397 domain-containing protein [Paenalkalicoccus suaedae]|uniref:DUF3397 domain-containing protein n=1 Tax=Paenalkalicoccus suaedae TaxID=2592382 RepID=A0A859FDU6_9BACI|nr:DUF3397 domain-containing protein [Paenalkalicoccus suaedae]QKS71533.1 DUF3397 domain-containing protein [Paenalkalicoccus suaedae]
MGDIAISLIGLIITVPLISMLLVYVVLRKVTKRKHKSLKLAVDSHVPIFAVSIYFLVRQLFHFSAVGVLLIALLTSALVFMIIHWRLTEEIDMRRILRGAWRFQFLLYLSAYIGLIVTGLILTY